MEPKGAISVKPWCRNSLKKLAGFCLHKSQIDIMHFRASSLNLPGTSFWNIDDFGFSSLCCVVVQCLFVTEMTSVILIGKFSVG